jgi:RND family efflux transporter, MFP subunit
MKNYYLKKLVLVLLVVGGSFSCKNDNKTSEKEGEVSTEVVTAKPKVRVQQVFEREVEQVETFTATVTAFVTNNISPKMGVRINKVYAEVGDNVRKGQVLAIMDDMSLKQAKLQMTNDSLEFDRTNQLYEIGGASKSEWDGRKLAYNISKTNYENLKENTVMVSPINGIVTARNYDAGDMFSPALPLYVVEQIRPVKLKVNVSEALFTKIKKGMPVDITLDVYGDEKFTGKVSLVYPSIDPTTRTFPVEITVDNANEKVRPGMFARVTFSYGTANHVVVPDMAVIKQTGSGDRYVYVVGDDGIVTFKKVELGRRFESEYELLGGISSGEKVVTEGHVRVTNGAAVEVIK